MRDDQPTKPASRQAIDLAVLCLQFIALYCWKVLHIEGAGNLLTAWVIVLLIAAVLLLVFADFKEPPPPRGLPAWLRYSMAWLFLGTLVWFGHGWLAGAYGASMSITFVTLGAWKRATPAQEPRT